MDPSYKAPVDPSYAATVDPSYKATVDPSYKATVDPSFTATVDPLSHEQMFQQGVAQQLAARQVIRSNLLRHCIQHNPEI